MSKFIKIIILLIFLIACSELFSKYFLGLGNPPLYVEDASIEYMLKPNQDVMRMGNHITVNEYGMRSSGTKSLYETSKNVVVFGDSIINGGNQTPDSSLATSILQQRLQSEHDPKYQVLNISAGSWGPQNWVAYANKYGFFNAEQIILLLSSHDYGDKPTFDPLNPNTHPTEKPFSAFYELLTRYVPRYIPVFKGQSSSRSKSEPTSEEIESAMANLKLFLSEAKSVTPYITVIQNIEQTELKSGYRDGYFQIKALCNELGIKAVNLNDYYEDAIKSGASPYRDNIHPNISGQKLISDAFYDAFMENNITE